MFVSGDLTKPSGKIGRLLKVKLLQDAANGLTGEEMGNKYNINPAAAIMAVREQLQDRDVWSALERQQLVVMDLTNLKNIAMERLNGGDVKDHALLLQVLVKLSDILDKQTKINEADLTKVSEAHGRALLGLVVAAFGRAKEFLAQEYPDVSLDEIENVFQTALVEESQRD